MARGETHVRRFSEVKPSGRIVLGCKCGERLVLLGREDDWYAEERSTFECECGKKLTLADRVVKGAGIAELFRGLGIPDR
jgi:hypothetical protein